jgi:sortase A
VRVFRGLLGLLGEFLITLGAFLLLFVTWQLWWTDVVSDADSQATVARMENGSWVQPDQAKLGDAFAIMRIPRFGADYARPVYQGTGRDVLMRGVGHYVGTADPGQIGNFAVAGHRTTHGKPFNQIAELKTGDVVLVETVDTYFVYRVTSDEIVPPTQTSVIWPVPGKKNATPTQALLTMTSCHPEFSSRERYVVHGLLAATYTRAQGVPAEVLKVVG